MNQGVFTLETDVSVRFAAPGDAAQMYALICELAAFHERDHLVKTTAKDILRDGFGDDPQFECVVAEASNTIVGMGVFRSTYSVWTASRGLSIEELVVAESARGHGIGQKIVQEVGRIALDRGCEHLELNVVHANPAKDFYDRFGFTHVEDVLTYRLGGKRFERLMQLPRNHRDE